MLAFGAQQGHVHSSALRGLKPAGCAANTPLLPGLWRRLFFMSDVPADQRASSSSRRTDGQRSGSPVATTTAEGAHDPYVLGFLGPFRLIGGFLGGNSIGLALFLGGVGFVIAGRYYFSVGVSPVDLPVVVWFATGASWAVLTLTPLWFGHVASGYWFGGRSVGHPLVRRLLVVLFILALMSTNTASLIGVPSIIQAPGPTLYALLPFIVGWFHPGFLERDFTFKPTPDRLLAILFGIISTALLYSMTVYPLVPKAFGGGKPVPVRITCDMPCSRAIDGLLAFEVFVTANAYYVALECPPSRPCPDVRKDTFPMWEDRPRFFAQFQRASVVQVVYLPDEERSWFPASLDAGTVGDSGTGPGSYAEASSDSGSDPATEAVRLDALPSPLPIGSLDAGLTL